MIQEVPHKEDGVYVIWISRHMLLGCGGSHLNEFAVYHRSQEKANQSLPLHSDGRGGRRARQRVLEMCDMRGSSSVRGRCLPQQTSLPRIFLKGHLF